MRAWLCALGLLAALLLANWPGASGYELLVNAGFESGTAGWSAISAELEPVSSPVHGDNQAVRLSGATSGAQVYQVIQVQPDQTYVFSGWISFDDPAVQSVYLRVTWFNSEGSLVSFQDSPFLTEQGSDYRFLTTGPLTSPVAAGVARVALRVQVSALFSLYLDDFSFDGPPPPSATPTVEPTPTATSTLTQTPSLTLTSSPTATATATAVPTAAPTATATATPTPTITLTLAPMTVTPTSTPTLSPTPSLTPRPTPTATPTVTAVATASPPTEPLVFGHLTNAGFEALRDDGTPFAWRKVGGEMAVTRTLRVEGSNALAFTSRTASTKWVYQTITVAGGSYYEGSGYALAGPGTEAAFLRLSWYESEDGSGEALDSVDSVDTLTAAGSVFTKLSTGPVQAPLEARSAKVKLMLRPLSDAPAAVYFDSISFSQAAPPTPSSTATSTPAETPTPTPTVPGPGGTPTPGQEPSPPAEPEVFARLTNGGFEEVREDGTPYGWRKAGGEMAVTPDLRAEGGLALAFTSRTASTKWVYQTVSVEPAGYYGALAYGAVPAGSGAEAFLRLSWYASEGGSGEAIRSDDSTQTPGAQASAGAFRLLSTGMLQAPSDARSAKVKLMLRPGSAAPATVYFDAVSFLPMVPPASLTPAPRATTAPQATPTHTPVSVAAAGPAFFTTLTNGGFEQVAPGGAPYGWREVGAEIAVTDAVRFEGAFALAVTSRTRSTKWVYQTVLVEPGAVYEAAAQTMNVNAEAAFLRVSWYGNEDGGGQAIDSVDSTESVPGGGQAFRRLSTGPARAPSEAQSAKVRLMLRPASDAPATVYFDAVTFARTAARPPSGGRAPAQRSGGEPEDAALATPAVLAAAASPVRLANVKPGASDESAVPAPPDGGGDWAAFLALGIAVAALGVAGMSEWRRLRERGDRTPRH